MFVRKARRRGWILTLAAFASLAAVAVVAVPPLRQPVRLVRLLLAKSPEALPVPVAGARAARLQNTWGAARGGDRRHEGIDIFAPRRTPVLSATDGIVISVGWNRLGGRTVTVLGPGRERHYYAHLDDYGRFEFGDWVVVGDTLGTVGTSGNAEGTPPHLHYGIYTTGGATNPYPRLRRQ